MKVIYNNEYGGFSWPQEIVDEFGIKHWSDICGNDAMLYASGHGYSPALCRV